MQSSGSSLAPRGAFLAWAGRRPVFTLTGRLRAEATFVHDQVASPDDGQVRRRVEEVEQLMRQGMLEVVPGMAVRVESVVTRSFDKSDLDPRHNA